jgi:GxxExxY protein
MQIAGKNLKKVIYPQLSYKINGILFAVHNELGQFCNEKQYCDLIENYLSKFNLRYEREKTLPPSFEREVKGRNKIDFLIEDKIILEIKTKRFLMNEDYYQVKRYLVALNKKLGILVNFRRKYITPKRILNSFAKG